MEYSTTLLLFGMRLRAILAANLQRLRRQSGISQEELAHRATIDRTYVSALERERYAATIDVIERMAFALDVDPAELLKQQDGSDARPHKLA